MRTFGTRAPKALQCRLRPARTTLSRSHSAPHRGCATAGADYAAAAALFVRDAALDALSPPATLPLAPKTTPNNIPAGPIRGGRLVLRSLSPPAPAPLATPVRPSVRRLD